MTTIDLHCDTASRLLYENLNLKESICKVDIQKLKKSKALAQVFANFIELNIVDDPYKEFIKMYNNLIKEIDKNSKDITLVRNLQELEEANKIGKIGAFLAIEEGEVLQGKVERVKEIYELGIRFLTLTWNFKNSIGYPNKDFKYKDMGLTERGKEIVCEMERLGIIPDCSHLSDGGFYDLVEICKKPFIATHSNARAITNHSRNLTDDMIVKLSNKGGVMGLNFCAPFLGEKDIPKIEDMIAHIKHIKNIGGIDVLAIGTDFDGIENEVEIKNIGEMGILAEALIREGFKESEIDKIFYGNVKRVLKECL
ncbi:dipeptidase [Clostridium chauvoei]|uniref:Dipeptidase n=2 Tax=Clostridium chauvoei TaxID=46867 RepID=A0ABD4RHG0_9CLOT|nr:dipeptidase [Clostridium chauvoei]ATD55315.1 peptidase M19 [Clostridium chauvoei]ATD57010.1 peptidase M19 [Clostridium chauvoei]MBX7280827.1 dipeptidase [Clostridium chauvoei]MBX7283310.1 dipeptidase [Clostridium chauvoei]MBX7285784.1 dipeptidase [Clostridium chauvoei]